MTAIARAQVYELEKHLQEMPQLELKVVEYFAHGVYGRELHIPKGTVLTGRIHKFTNFNILIQGDMTVSGEEGMIRIQAPFSVVSPAGTKRIAYAHEDCIWTTVIGTELKDGDQIEEEFTADSEQSYLAFCDTLKMIGE